MNYLFQATACNFQMNNNHTSEQNKMFGMCILFCVQSDIFCMVTSEQKDASFEVYA